MSFAPSLARLTFFFFFFLARFFLVLEQRNLIPPAPPLALPNSLASSPSPSFSLKDSPLSALWAVYLRGEMRRRGGPVCFVLAVNNGPQSVLMDYSNIWYPPVSLSLSLSLSLSFSPSLRLPLPPFPPSLRLSLFRFFFCLFLRSLSLSHPNMQGGLEARFITHKDLFALAT